jgi:ABC-type Fe3+-hydroxamate transport system substrate-binding protein
MGTLAMGRLALLAGAALLVLVVAACGERSEPTGAQAELYPVTVPSAAGGKALVLKTPAKRIAVISPSVRDVLLALGARKALAGMPLARNGNLDTAALRALHADLLVASSTTGDQTLAQAARTVRDVPVYRAPDDSIRGVEETLTDLGVITAHQAEASRLVREIEEKRATARRHLARASIVSAFISTGFFQGLSAFTTVSNQSLAGDLLREAHARNVAGDATELDVGQLARLAPRWIVVTTQSKTTLADLRKSKATRELAAVRAGRFRTIDADLLTPGPAIGDGLLRLAQRLHPDAFR